MAEIEIDGARDMNHPGEICVDATPLDQPVRTRGIGTYTQSLVETLQRNPEECDSLLYLRFRSARKASPAREFSLPLHRCPERLLWIASRLILRRYLESKKIRLFHSTLPYNLPLSPQYKTIATVYDLIPLLYYDQYLKHKKANAKYSYSYYLRTLPRLDHLIAISEQTRNDCVVHLGIPPAKITVIPIGVDGHVFKKVDDEMKLSALRAKFSLTNDFFLYVGGADFRKNAGRLLEAFADAAPAIRHDLVCSGGWSDNERGNVMAKVRTLGLEKRVRILSHTEQEDLVGLYSMATALLFPSLYEGFGLPVVEAFKCRTAVLCSKNSSLGEIAEGAAVLVDPMKVDEIARGIVALASNDRLRADLASKGFDKSRLYTPQNMMHATVAVYNKVLEQ